MRLEYDLNLEQSQKLIMTSELRQAIEILQFNSLELNNYINGKLEENPMLERSDDLIDEVSRQEDGAEDLDWSKYFENNNNYEYKSERDKNIRRIDFQSFIKKKESLGEYLIKQLCLLSLDKKEEELGRIIINSIDQDGYLACDLYSLSKRFSYSVSELEKILKKVQKLDPVGVGSRNLEECLAIQIEDKYLGSDLDNMLLLVENHMEDVAYNRISTISNRLEISDSKTELYIKNLKELQPKPGRAISDGSDSINYIIPDAYIFYEDGKLLVKLNEALSPNIGISSFYKRMITNGKDKLASQYLKSNYDKALWLIKSIEQRKKTIKSILEYIIYYQKEFFEYGVASLKPLTMKELADQIGVHESTVSRATRDKYVQTPQGLFPFKYFFSSSLKGLNGKISSETIKNKIKNLIENESNKKPLSDQKISDKLKNSGIEISRRTVAKYRDEMNILSSSFRRR